MAFFRSRGIRIALGGLLFLAVCAGIGAAVVYALLIRDLPDFTSLDDYNPPVVSEVFDRNGLLIGEFYTEQRRLVPIDEIPAHVQHAFVAAEDGAFYEHSGIDYVSIIRAAYTNFVEGEIAQGASTITQQMVKSLLLTPERTYKRKMREVLLSWQIERRFSKDEILYLYLNQIYFGNSAWGIGQAARAYYGKDAKDLTVSEAALLAGLPQRPSAYDPNRNPESAEARRRYVLGRMLADGYIEQDVYEAELAAPPVIQGHADDENIKVAGYFTEEVRRLLFEKLDGEIVLNAGLRIDTTLDVSLQRAAREAVQHGLVAHDHRRGYRGPIRKVAKAAIATELETIAETNRKTFDEAEAPASEETTPAIEELPDVAANGSSEEAGDAEAEEQDTAAAESASNAKPKTGIEIAYALPFAKPLDGVVISVSSKKKVARIGFGEGLEGLASLSDNDWARKPNLQSRPQPVENISSIFRAGDVARFVRLPDGEDPKKNDDGEIEPRLTIWQEPTAEGALLSLDNRTGDVIAMVGGYDFARSEFNRAVQAQRQPGSAFKPFIYGAALTRGYTPVSTLIDRPVVYTDPASGFVWAPRNYGRKFYGPMTMRDALKKSINNATVHLFRDLGVRYVIDYARRFGIQAPLSADLSLALGSSSVTLLELTRAYAVYPRGGSRVIPRFIKQVTDRDGNILLSDVPLGDIPPPVLKPLAKSGEEREESYPDSEIMPTQQIISPADAYLVADLLRAVVQEGTGARLRSLGRTLAGKTGTTNDYSDAWFMGFSPEITTGVWVGNDDNAVLGYGESGGKTALPIWGEYMKTALAPYPRRDFEVPPHIEFQRVDRSSGLLAGANTEDAYFQPFLEGTAPVTTFTEQTKTKKTQQDARDDIF